MFRKRSNCKNNKNVPVFILSLLCLTLLGIIHSTIKNHDEFNNYFTFVLLEDSASSMRSFSRISFVVAVQIFCKSISPDSCKNIDFCALNILKVRKSQRGLFSSSDKLFDLVCVLSHFSCFKS